MRFIFRQPTWHIFLKNNASAPNKSMFKTNEDPMYDKTHYNIVK